MSYGAFVHESIQQRQAHAARQRDRRSEAYRLIRDRMPEFAVDGYFDGFAVKALLALWAEHGRGNVTVGMVRDRREVLLARRDLLRDRPAIGDEVPA